LKTLARIERVELLSGQVFEPARPHTEAFSASAFITASQLTEATEEISAQLRPLRPELHLAE